MKNSEILIHCAGCATLARIYLLKVNAGGRSKFQAIVLLLADGDTCGLNGGCDPFEEFGKRFCIGLFEQEHIIRELGECEHIYIIAYGYGHQITMLAIFLIPALEGSRIVIGRITVGEEGPWRG